MPDQQLADNVANSHQTMGDAASHLWAIFLMLMVK